MTGRTISDSLRENVGTIGQQTILTPLDLESSRPHPHDFSPLSHFQVDGLSSTPDLIFLPLTVRDSATIHLCDNPMSSSRFEDARLRARSNQHATELSKYVLFADIKSWRIRHYVSG
jgi:hypothetical protein